jgi:hypothetical protein
MVVAVVCAQLVPVTASAEDLHNVVYRARVDGISRGALITYKINDTQVNSADPTMLPGRTFEADAVLADPQQAGMQVSIQWPYSANLHCEIVVDDAIVAQADQFIGPRLTPARDDPNYGVMACGAPLSNAGDGGGNVVNTSPVDTAIPPDSGAPAEPAPAPAEPAPAT